MAIFPEKGRDGRPTGVFIVKVMRGGMTTVQRTRDGKRAKAMEEDLKRGRSLPDQAIEALPVPTPVAEEYTLRMLLPEAIGSYEGSKDYKQSAARLETAFGILGLDKPVASIRTKELDALVAKLRGSREGKPLNNKTINRYLATVSKALKWAWKRDHIPGVPSIPRLEESVGRVDWLAEEHEPKLLAWLEMRGKGDVALIVRVLIISGFRISELLSRKPEDLVDNYLHLHPGETKNDEARAAYLPNDLAEPLAALLAIGMPHYRVVLDWLQQASKALGINNLTPHVLRHTTATRLNDLGWSTATIQDYMGHRSINTTLKYVHVRKETTKAAAESLLTKRPTKSLTNGPTKRIENLPLAGKQQLPNSLVLRDFLEASPGIEPGCKDLQSSA